MVKTPVVLFDRLNSVAQKIVYITNFFALAIGCTIIVGYFVLFVYAKPITTRIQKGIDKVMLQFCNGITTLVTKVAEGFFNVGHNAMDSIHEIDIIGDFLVSANRPAFPTSGGLILKQTCQNSFGGG